ncbi:hypothetical protein OG897_11950 [Streptomyces sp. NBC_00237]|uniref:hypothetical protein n=1 Tax=Streptomyces sp. NBC_00237 TaxID=2975687 RepID=UPI00224F67D1|nr:hypothetical protein [Streptomyces sp. NBC_00237]MCX5202160.1 hypothetical protein [Streptomyces sp. NBC_00237]
MGPTQKVVGAMRIGRKSRTAVWTAAAVLALAATATACGEGGEPEKTPPGTSAPASTGIDPQPSDSASASGPAETEGAKKEVTKNWQAFFDPKVKTDQKVKLLENGETLKPLLLAFTGDERGGQTSTRVKDVRFNSATEATVTYDLLLNGAPVLPNSKGTSVLQDQRWKVSVKSLCALVKLSGNAAAPGC